MNPEMYKSHETPQTKIDMCSQLTLEQLQASLNRKLKQAAVCLQNGQTEIYNAWMNLVRSLEILIAIKQAPLAS